MPWVKIDHNGVQKYYPDTPEREPDVKLERMGPFNLEYSVWWEEQVVQQAYQNNSTMFGLIHIDGKWGITVARYSWISKTFNNELKTWLEDKIEEELFGGV